MCEPRAWLNGQFISASEATVSIDDTGFVLGATATEQLRTFGGRVFRLMEHLARLEHSLEILGIQPGITRDELAGVVDNLARTNHALLNPADDLGLGIFVTPGQYPTLSGGQRRGPTVCAYAFPLAFHLWAHKYESGESVVVTDVEQVSPRSWPRELKCRSRVHYYLADRKAAAIEQDARALLVDDHGWVTEATTANLLIYSKNRGLVTPPRDMVLPGISLAVIRSLAQSLSIPLSEARLRPVDISAADEVMLTSTSTCVLPVVRFNGQPIATGQPSEVFHQLLAAWNDLVGLDIAAQARRFAQRS